MKQKIRKSMALVIATTLIISYALIIISVYQQTVGMLEDEIEQEADYISASIHVSGDIYLDQMDQVRENSRITLIDQNGDVLYDSKEDEITLENHNDRPEVIAARKNGSGKEVRKSDSLGKIGRAS